MVECCTNWCNSFFKRGGVIKNCRKRGVIENCLLYDEKQFWPRRSTNWDIWTVRWSGSKGHTASMVECCTNWGTRDQSPWEDGVREEWMKVNLFKEDPDQRKWPKGQEGVREESMNEYFKEDPDHRKWPKGHSCQKRQRKEIGRVAMKQKIKLGNLCLNKGLRFSSYQVLHVVMIGIHS